MSKTIKIGINGVGRIGRNLIRIITDKKSNGQLNNLELVAVNNPGDPSSYVHLLKYDSLLRTASQNISYADGILNIGENKIKFFTEKDPAAIDWNSQNVDIVIDATGRFKNNEELGPHLGGSVKKVILCAPGKVDETFVMGINHFNYDPAKHHIVSNASCTTNCLAPVVKILNDNFTILSGLMTTVHSYTSDQNLLDNSHSDLRRARAAALSMIPTSTGAAKSIGLVIPELKGKLDGYAVRVPTPNVSLVDLTVNLETSASVSEINELMKQASENQLQGILAYEEEPLVSIDFLGRPESSVFDPDNTKVIDNMVKVVAWYDNEFGFSNRVIDLASFIGEKL